MENFEMLWNKLYQFSSMTYRIRDHISVYRENINGQPNRDWEYCFIIELSVIDTIACICCLVEILLKEIIIFLDEDQAISQTS